MILYYSVGEIKDESEAIGLVKGEMIGLAKGKALGLAKGEEIGLARGEEIGLAKGEALGLANAILIVLSARGMTVSDAVRESILRETDHERLERWIVKATVGTSIDE